MSWRTPSTVSTVLSLSIFLFAAATLTHPANAAPNQYLCGMTNGVVMWPDPPLTSDTIQGCVTAVQAAASAAGRYPAPCWKPDSHIEDRGISLKSLNGWVIHYFYLVWDVLPNPPSFCTGPNGIPWKTSVEVTGPECSIQLSNDAGSPPGYLAEIEPDKTVDTLRAEVTCGGVATTAEIALAVKAGEYSGGHQHHDVQRRPGTLTPGFGTSPLVFSFAAPSVAGDHTVTAKCSDRDCESVTGTIWVGVRGLQPIGPSPWSLDGAKPYHPDNHYLTVSAFLVLQQLGLQWRRLYVPFGPVFSVNDASLERGGLFDCCDTYTDKAGVTHYRQTEGWWTPPHSEHRRGTVVDINGIRREDEKDFEKYANERLGADAQIHGAGTGRHYHVRLKGAAE